MNSAFHGHADISKTFVYKQKTRKDCKDCNQGT